MYNSEFAQAREQLKLAFSLCNNKFMKNKQKILRYLIPCEMLRGNFPSPQLLQQYDLKEYNGISSACMKGNLKELEAAIDLHMDYFISLGVFISIEKLRLVTLRNFVKRVANAIKECPELQCASKNPKQLNLKLLFRPLQKEWDEDLDMDELECLLANLIGNGYIRGYISHECQILVLASEAFPEVQ